jgi:hypothetical protein
MNSSEPSSNPKDYILVKENENKRKGIKNNITYEPMAIFAKSQPRPFYFVSMVG